MFFQCVFMASVICSSETTERSRTFIPEYLESSGPQGTPPGYASGIKVYDSSIPLILSSGFMKFISSCPAFQNC